MAEDGNAFAAPTGSSALFLDESVVQGGFDADESNIDLAAMKALMDETPEETAEILKEQGNLALMKGKKFYPEAFKYYSDAIALKGSNPSNNSIYHSNRAHVSILLGNWGRAIKDCDRAIHLHPKNVKAYFRAAKAAVALENHEAAIRYCTQGLEQEEENKELQQIAEKSRKKLAEHEAQMKVAEDRRAAAEALADALAARHVAVGPAEYGSHIGGRKAHLDSHGLLHWPCLMIYPQPMAVDVIEDFGETDRFEDHVNEMFGEGAAPLDWDEQGAYTREAVELYYQTHAVGVLSRKQLVESLLTGDDGSEEGDGPPKDWGARRWKKVKLGAKLSEVVSQPGHVLLGVPGHGWWVAVFYVVVKDTEFRDRFLSGAWTPP